MYFTGQLVIKWEPVPDSVTLQFGRSCAAHCTIGSSLYVFGGWDGRECRNDVEVIHISATSSTCSNTTKYTCNSEVSTYFCYCYYLWVSRFFSFASIYFEIRMDFWRAQFWVQDLRNCNFSLVERF